jgi:hypothetical protein
VTLEELQNWVLADSDIGDQVIALRRFSALRCIAAPVAPESDLNSFDPNWPRLLLAASILAQSSVADHVEAALMIAHAGLIFSERQDVNDASGIILSQLANHRAVGLAYLRGALRPELSTRLGISEQLLQMRRELQQTIFPRRGENIAASSFQQQFWKDLERAQWVSATAPTAAGKTYLVLRWLLEQFVIGIAKLAIFIAPTRALVGEIERQLLDLSANLGISALRVASLPLTELGDRTRPTILVFTQERLHVFLNALKQPAPIDITIVDEVHKLGDGLRGVILQDAIERVIRSNPAGKLIFLSPLTENPEMLVQDAPPAVDVAVAPSETPTVTQNLFLAEQRAHDSTSWQLSLRQSGEAWPVAQLSLHARPDAQRKRLSYVALALGRGQTGTLVYANGADEAEKLAWQIFDGLADEFGDKHETLSDLKDLSDFARDTVHSDFQLVDLLKRGVAFHYGNMPSLLRSEIERLFREGTIRFLVCTSTLIEGVNLACQTIVVRGPRKGNKKPMTAHDFWNLAGRAGRWGQDFHGNIVCVDAGNRTQWPTGVPRRSKYPIARETDVVLQRRDEVLAFIRARSGPAPDNIDAGLEQVSAYLMAWHIREGSILQSPAARRLEPGYAAELNDVLSTSLNQVDVPGDIISKHPGVSAIALQSLLEYFRKRKKPIEELVPSTPESDDAWTKFIAIFRRIHDHLYPAFFPGRIPVFALVTVEWMRGQPLNVIIRRRIKWLEDHNRSFNIASVIRETMRDVEEVARFRAPKYLAAYIDVLRYHLANIGRSELLPDNLSFDLYLEFGVATKTLLSLIGLGLSRTSAVAINEFLAADDLDEGAVLLRLSDRRWTGLQIPAVVKREITELVARRVGSAA